ncbi:MAG: enoyl-CoA hydratase/isomerase family protein [Archaeoglobaceae archaeon]|nr:enoyl-CoA hydratase/isomerase family protein [Archaeoglobaceae archaeon]MCX8151553.1 enoyl-CoA hydratase/isomerase family protein [Archaeoglobaceae archaeon]MDW8013211.1 enoyl-CoA hydratase/isomerase family protein [Archaeoglobaceae archaeon]
MTVEIRKDDGVLWVKLKRPEALNSINEEIVEGLKKAVELVKKEKDVRVMVITGEGRAFCAGADVKMFSKMNAYEARKIIEELGKTLEEIEDLEIPVVAAVNGLALGGGCEIAMACDIIIASDKAVFGQPEINLGIIPGAGGTQRLARIVGWKKAMELCLTGDRIDAREAEKLGLVNKVVEHEKLFDEVRKFAEKLKSKSPTALMLAKQAVNRGFKISLKDGISYERDLFALSFASDDAREGINAFVEKREAKFKKER